MAWLPDGETFLKIFLFVSTESTNVTDRQMDGRTDTACWHRLRLCIALRGKKTQITVVLLCLSEILTVGHSARPAFDTGGTVWQPATWLDVGATLPTDGIVVRWRLYCRVARLPVRLQIWRPTIGRNFRLIGETVVRPTAAGVFRV